MASAHFLSGQETALPLIKELYRLTAGSNEVYIHSVWVVERPNHGDAAKLNEEVLKHYVGKSCRSSAFHLVTPLN